MSRMRMYRSLALACVVTTACAGSQIESEKSAHEPAAEPTSEVVLRSDVEWGPLNPARGDQSPRAGALWGDRAGAGPSGFLVQFVEGFSSPPHVHNVTYRGVVISGLIHNDDPGAEEMWMPTGSFWTQPAGEAHITAADGSENLIYVEIQDGPYLVRPTEEAFDNGERPVNVHASNLVWPDAPGQAGGSKLAFLWGNPQEDQWSGTLVKLPAGFAGALRSRGETLRAVVIEGRPQYQAPGQADAVALTPGSYFGSTGESTHRVSCGAGEECIIYVRARGKFDIV